MLDALETCRPGTAASGARSLLIDGWRGVNHSLALVNQYQILEFMKIAGLKLSHRDMPFPFPWQPSRNDPGFSNEAMQRIMALPEPALADIDAVYRICSPFRADDVRAGIKTVTFMVTEMGLSANAFAQPKAEQDFFTRDENCITTPSRWARDRIVDYGFAPEKIHIVPHAVDTGVFYPQTQEERQVCRTNLGLRDDETVFVNVGAALWNKGVDLLLRAFAVLRSRGRRVRLLVKDLRGVYGISVNDMLPKVAAVCEPLRNADTLSAMSVIAGNLSRGQLRQLFGAADCYVSPYRAEGFNLPVLEAIACGTPVIVTRGGATDDFCNDKVAWLIQGQAGSLQGPGGEVYRFTEPDFDELVEAMAAVCEGSRLPAAAADRSSLLQTFSWSRAAEALVQLTVDSKEEAVLF
jgi:glycosyltransferase involved in cell wall biosynthesis